MEDNDERNYKFTRNLQKCTERVSKGMRGLLLIILVTFSFISAPYLVYHPLFWYITPFSGMSPLFWYITPFSSISPPFLVYHPRFWYVTPFLVYQPRFVFFFLLESILSDISIIYFLFWLHGPLVLFWHLKCRFFVMCLSPSLYMCIFG